MRNAKGHERISTFVLCLLGERRGRLLDARDRKKLMVMNKNGKYDRFLKIENQITVLEMELMEALILADHSKAIVCCRDPAFLNNKEFIQVCLHLRMVSESFLIYGSGGAIAGLYAMRLGCFIPLQDSRLTYNCGCRRCQGASECITAHFMMNQTQPSSR